MGDTAAIYILAALALIVMVVTALPLSGVRRIFAWDWFLTYEQRPRPNVLGQVLSAAAGTLLVVLAVGLIAWNGKEGQRPEQAAPQEHYVSLGLILVAAAALLMLVVSHHRRRRLGQLAEPDADVEVNAAADSARIPALAIMIIAAVAGLLTLTPWPNGVERYPGASYEERVEPMAGLVELVSVAPVRVDDLGDRIRINYLGYAIPECDRLRRASVAENQTSVEVSVQLGHIRGHRQRCATWRSLLLYDNDAAVQYYFEEQLEAPLGDREVILLP